LDSVLASSGLQLIFFLESRAEQELREQTLEEKKEVKKQGE
jgi:hypothetical protein